MKVFTSLFSKSDRGVGQRPTVTAVSIRAANYWFIFLCGYLLKERTETVCSHNILATRSFLTLSKFSPFFLSKEAQRRTYLLRKLKAEMVSLVATSDEGAALDPQTFGKV